MQPNKRFKGNYPNTFPLLHPSRLGYELMSLLLVVYLPHIFAQISWFS